MIWLGSFALFFLVFTYMVWRRKDGVSFSLTVLPFWGGVWARTIHHDYILMVGFWQLTFHSQDLLKQYEEVWLDARIEEFEAGRAMGYSEAAIRYNREYELP